MSPYMRAYEAGIKLAQLEWMSKVANPEAEEVAASPKEPVDEFALPTYEKYMQDEASPNPMSRAIAQNVMGQNYYDDSYSDHINDLKEQGYGPELSRQEFDDLTRSPNPMSRALYSNMPSFLGGGDPAQDYQDYLDRRSALRAPQEPATSDSRSFMEMLDPDGSVRADLSPDSLDPDGTIRSDLATLTQDMNRPTQEAPSISLEDYQAEVARVMGENRNADGSLSIEGQKMLSDLGQRYEGRIQQPTQQTAPAPAAAPARLMADPSGEGRAPRELRFGAGLAEDTQQAAPARLMADPARQQAAPARQQTTPATQQAAPARQQAAPARQQAAPASQQAAPARQQAAVPNRFSAVSGGYGAQLRSLRQQAGLSNADRSFLQKANYSQLASAMGNRGLQVGDTFDVNALVQRMRQQGQGGSGTLPQIGIQNKRGRSVTRSTMPNAQAAAGVNPATGRNFNMGGSAATNPSNFKMPEMIELKRT